MLLRALTVTATATVAASASIVVLSAAAASIVSSVVDVMAPPIGGRKKVRSGKRASSSTISNPESSYDDKPSRRSRPRASGTRPTPPEECLQLELVDISSLKCVTELEKSSTTSDPWAAKKTPGSEIPSEGDIVPASATGLPMRTLSGSPSDEMPGVVIVSPIEPENSQDGNNADTFFSIAPSGVASPFIRSTSTHTGSNLHPVALDTALLELADRRTNRSLSAWSAASDESWATAM